MFYVLLSLLAVVGIGFSLWVLRRAPWRGAHTRYPILLCHGVMGFSRLGMGKFGRDYFNGIADHLEGLGNEVHKPRVPATASIVERASSLAEAIRAMPARRVHLVAHSMGGLDARYAVAKLGVAGKVASLTTISTPHRGTRVADVGAGVLKAILNRTAVAAVTDLTSNAATRFNTEVPDMRGVRYGSIVAAASRVHPLLKPTHMLLNTDGPNDGMVPAKSQEWGRVLLRVEADHWGVIGWSKTFDARQMYEQLACALRKGGG